jgi:PKD repeat protein
MNNKIIFLIITSLMILLIACEDDPKPNQPPLLVIAANPASGMLPLSVTFTASGQDPEGTQLNYNWTFGDGKGISTQQNPVYIYSDAGTFTATCTVTDSGSSPQSATSTVTIEVLGQKPVLSSVSPAGCVMHVPSFTLTATGSSFHQDAKIMFNDVQMNTTYISSKKLICTIQPGDTVLQSLLGNGLNTIIDTSSVVKIKILNPGANGGESDAADFTVHSNYSFDSPRTMDTGSGDNPPAILIDYSGRLHLFKGEMQHSQSIDNGETWSNFIQMTEKQTAVTYQTQDYSICIDANNNIYVAYIGKPDTIYNENKYCDIWLASLEGQNSEWTTKNITGKWGGDGYEIPIITATKNSILMMVGIPDWGCYQNYLIAPPWTEWTQSPNMRGGSVERDHAFTVDPSENLHYAIITAVAGQENTPNIVHFSCNKDLSTWSSTHLISSSDGFASSICITSDLNGTFYALWLDSTGYGQPQKLYFSRSTDGGVKWTKRKMLSPTGGFHFISAQTDSAGNVIVVFSKEDYGAEKVYFFRSIDHGINWTASKKVTDQDGRTSWQSFAIESSGRMHVVWHGGGVYYARSTVY